MGRLERLLAALALLLAAPSLACASAHVYWRLNVTVDQSCFAGGNHFANIDDVFFYDVNGNNIATTGGTASDSGNLASSAANAFDNNGGTLDSIDTNGLYGVGGHPTTVFLEYAFSSAKDPGWIKVNGTLNGGGFGCVDGQGFNTFTAQYSDDNASWTTAHTTTNFRNLDYSPVGYTGVNGTAHRYWSFLQINAKLTNEPDAAEIEFHATPGGSDLSSCTTISSSDLGGFPKTNAHDSNTGTFWVSNTTTRFTSYIGCDYGTAKTVNEFKLRVRNDSFATNEGTRDGMVRYSDDGSTWTTQWVVTDQASWSAGEVRTFANDGYSASNGPANGSMLLLGVGH